MYLCTGDLHGHSGHHTENIRDKDRLYTVHYYFCMIYLKLKEKNERFIDHFLSFHAVFSNSMCYFQSDNRL